MLAEHHGYTFVTPEAFESTVFRDLLDLLDRKRVTTGVLGVAKAAAIYTMTVAQAADHLGIAPARCVLRCWPACCPRDARRRDPARRWTQATGARDLPCGSRSAWSQ